MTSDQLKCHRLVQPPKLYRWAFADHYRWCVQSSPSRLTTEPSRPSWAGSYVVMSEASNSRGPCLPGLYRATRVCRIGLTIRAKPSRAEPSWAEPSWDEVALDRARPSRAELGQAELGRNQNRAGPGRVEPSWAELSQTWAASSRTEPWRAAAGGRRLTWAPLGTVSLRRRRTSSELHHRSWKWRTDGGGKPADCPAGRSAVMDGVHRQWEQVSGKFPDSVLSQECGLWGEAVCSASVVNSRTRLERCDVFWRLLDVVRCC